MAADLYYWLRAQPVYGMFVVAVRVSETPKTWAEFRPEVPFTGFRQEQSYFSHPREDFTPPSGGDARPAGGPGEPPTPQRVDDRTLSWDETRVLPAKPYQYEHEQPKLKKRCCQEPDEEPSDTPLTDSLLWMKGLLEGGDDDALSGE
jgi:hypothetical protein